MSIKVIFNLEPVMKRAFDSMMKGFVFLTFLFVVYIVVGLTGTCIVAGAEVLFFLWNRYEMRHAGGGGDDWKK